MRERTLIEKLLAFLGFPVAERDGPTPPVLPPPSPAITAPSAPAPSTLDDRLPPSALQRVTEIRAMLGKLEQQTADRALFEEKLEIERLKANHLPRLLRSYVDIPPEHRGEIFRETGHSASYLLNERLDKILKRLREMSAQLARGNLNAFSENIRFVDTQYGASSPFD